MTLDRFFFFIFLFHSLLPLPLHLSYFFFVIETPYTSFVPSPLPRFFSPPLSLPLHVAHCNGTKRGVSECRHNTPNSSPLAHTLPSRFVPIKKAKKRKCFHKVGFFLLYFKLPVVISAAPFPPPPPPLRNSPTFFFPRWFDNPHGGVSLQDSC